MCADRGAEWPGCVWSIGAGTQGDVRARDNSGRFRGGPGIEVQEQHKHAPGPSLNTAIVAGHYQPLAVATSDIIDKGYIIMLLQAHV